MRAETYGSFVLIVLYCMYVCIVCLPFGVVLSARERERESVCVCVYRCVRESIYCFYLYMM